MLSASLHDHFLAEFLPDCVVIRELCSGRKGEKWTSGNPQAEQQETNSTVLKHG
jgi:hypothetical protein